LLIILPIFFFLSLYLNILGVTRKKAQDPPDWRRSFLISAIIWATLAVVFVEGLSLLRGILSKWVAILWATALIGSVAYGLRQGAFQRALTSPLFPRAQLKFIDITILIGLIVIILILGLLAWISPPNNIDALAYHMPRIAHWIQHSSLRHYPTAYHPQLWNPPGAEILILNGWILWGSDQPVNLLQWFSMVTSLVGVTAIAHLLGAKPRGQLVASAFTISIPMGILQATSAQTDYVTTLWLICIIYFTILSKKRNLEPLEWASLLLATGLGILTKGTFYAYVVPILLWYFIPRLIQRGVWKTLLEGLCFVGATIALNLGYWVRNFITYGGPLGPSEWLGNHAVLQLKPAVWFSGIFTKVLLNFSTPWENINAFIVSTVNHLHQTLNVDLSRFDLIWAWNHEDSAGNPVHLLALLFTGLILLARGRKNTNNHAYRYIIVVYTAFLLHATLVITDQFGIRYQLPFFVLGAPIIGIAFTQWKMNRISAITGTTLLIISLPWVLFNSARPIIGMRPRPEPLSLPCIAGCTRTGSVFSRSPTDILFANWPEVQEYVTEAASATEATGCDTVGLMIDSHDDEYLFWRMLDAPRSGIQIETIYTFPELERYMDPTYKTCAIICTICRDQDLVHGLQQTYTFGYISVYTGSEFQE
jgi:hypothetical protein